MKKQTTDAQGGIRLIASDLDDTLVRKDKSISAYTKEVFARCRAKGIVTVIATARLLASTQKEQEILQPDMRIVSGGGMTLMGDKALFFQGMGKVETSALLSLLQQAGAEGILAGCRNQMYTNSSNFAASPTLHTAVLHDFNEPAPEEACQIFFRLPDEEAAEEIKKRFSHLEWTKYRDGTYGVTAKGVSKAQALEQVAGWWKIKMEQVAAFGDDEGDCEMLRQCGMGVAVENALPCAKEAASYLTKSNGEDGVAWFVDRYILQSR